MVCWRPGSLPGRLAYLVKGVHWSLPPKRLTLQSRGRHPASRAPPLISNVRHHMGQAEELSGRIEDFVASLNDLPRTSRPSCPRRSSKPWPKDWSFSQLLPHGKPAHIEKPPMVRSSFTSWRLARTKGLRSTSSRTGRLSSARPMSTQRGRSLQAFAGGRQTAAMPSNPPSVELWSSRPWLKLGPAKCLSSEPMTSMQLKSTPAKPRFTFISMGARCMPCLALSRAATALPVVPNPSIERTCPGKPGQASHLKR